MNTRQPIRLAGKGVHIKHPDANELAGGIKPRATLNVNRNLASGKLDVVELTEGDLITLIESAAVALRVLKAGR